MEIVVTILGIVCTAEFLGLISFFVYLKLNKREKKTEVVSQEIDLAEKYINKILALEKERDEFWTQQHTDTQWIKDTLNIIVKYLNGGLQEWIVKHGLSINEG